MNKKEGILAKIRELDFTADEAKVYFELLRGPNTHLQLSHATGVNRTKVYRIIETLEKRSLVARRTDDRGTFLVATDPATLEVSLVTKQKTLEKQYEVVKQLIPTLNLLQNKSNDALVVRTYEGYAGLKQMCWHELKTKGDVLTLGNGTVEQNSGDVRWAAKHRNRQLALGYKTREILNYDYTTGELPELASEKLINSKLYEYRKLSPDIVRFDGQTVIYNDTVAIYHWKHDEKVGIEIISPTYANMMRQIFTHYWEIASPLQPS